MARRAVATAVCIARPIPVVPPVAARILTPSLMRCQPAAVAVVVLQGQPSAVLLVRISPLVL